MHERILKRLKFESYYLNNNKRFITNYQDENGVRMMQRKLNNKLIVEDGLQKIGDVKSENFLPTIAYVIVSQVINEEHCQKNHKHRKKIHENSKFCL